MPVDARSSLWASSGCRQRRINAVSPNLSEHQKTAQDFINRLANGPTKAYAAAHTLLKAWSIAAADVMMLDVTMDLGSAVPAGARTAMCRGVHADVAAAGRVEHRRHLAADGGCRLRGCRGRLDHRPFHRQASAKRLQPLTRKCLPACACRSPLGIGRHHQRYNKPVEEARGGVPDENLVVGDYGNRKRTLSEDVQRGWDVPEHPDGSMPSI
jgi:hypothetical protein